MDRISTLRNIEDALTEFENGNISFEELNQRVSTILQTFATDFEDELQAVYQVDSVIVVAESPSAARDQAAEIADINPESASVHRLSDK